MSDTTDGWHGDADWFMPDAVPDEFDIHEELGRFHAELVRAAQRCRTLIEATESQLGGVGDLTIMMTKLVKRLKNPESRKEYADELHAEYEKISLEQLTESFDRFALLLDTIEFANMTYAINVIDGIISPRPANGAEPTVELGTREEWAECVNAFAHDFLREYNDLARLFADESAPWVVPKRVTLTAEIKPGQYL